MTVELPEWQPFPGPEAPWTPEPTERGRVVVALAPPPSSREQWSATIVMDLLDRWGESGHRVVLADCVLEHPMLHRSTGLANDEGLADAALFGASVSRVARPVPGRSFFFVGAGSPVGDAESVLLSARLGRLREGFRDAGVTFVAFVRQGCVGVTALLDDADDVVVLAQDGDPVPASARDASGKVRAVVGPAMPPVEAEPEPSIDAVAQAPDDAGAWEEPEPQDEADAWDIPLTDAEPTEPVAAGVATDAVPVEEPADAGAPGATEAAMDFSSQATEGDADVAAGDPADDVHRPEAEADAMPAAPVRTRRAQRGADPDARRKLLWVALAVLVLVVLVVLGALG